MYVSFFISEFKKWARDPMMRFMLFYPLLFGLIGRYALPAIAETSDFAIEPNADFILAVLALITPLAFGALTGFSILEDRDDHIVNSIRVTPLTFNQFMSFRMVMVYILTFVACVFVMWFSDIGDLAWRDILVVAFLASFSAPVTGLVINIFSHNKIEGFAIMKLLGMIIILPVISLIFTDAKELFFAVVPPFWPAKMISSVIRGDEAMYLNYSLYFWLGLGYAVLVNALSYVRFIKKVIAEE